MRILTRFLARKILKNWRNIQRIVDRIYDRFITKVADSRKLPKDKVQEIAQGRVWSGTAAKQLGLVDEIGGLEDAVREAAKQAKLGDDWQLEEYPKRRSFEERILERLSGVRVAETSHQTRPADGRSSENTGGIDCCSVHERSARSLRSLAFQFTDR